MAESQVYGGAERHGGIEGETSLDCCDARVAVVKVWEVLDACLRAPADAPLLSLLASLRCPSCRRILTAFNIMATLSAKDVRRINQRLTIAAMKSLTFWPQSAIHHLLQDRVTALSKDPWKNALPLLHELTTEQLQNFLSAHQPPSERGVPPSHDKAALLAGISACIRCRGTLREAAHGLACMALLTRIDALLKRELPLAEMIPSAQQMEQSVVQQDSALDNSRRDSSMAGVSSAGEVAQDDEDDWMEDSASEAQAQAGSAGAATVGSAVPAAEHSRPRRGFVKGTGYGGDPKADARAAQNAARRQAALSAATQEDTLKTVLALDALCKACAIKDTCLPTFMVVALAVLLEGSLANCLYAMLTAESLDSLVASPDLLEAQIKLVNTVLHTQSLQPVVLMPAGQPPITCTAARHAQGLYGLGYAAGGASVRTALADVSRAAERLRASGMDFNEVNEDGLHINIDQALQLALFISSTAALVEEEAEDIDELVDLPQAPPLTAVGGAAPPTPSGGATTAAHDAVMAETVSELRKRALIQCPLLNQHALRTIARQINVTSSSSRARSRAVTRAVLSLDGQLPISWESSVHVAVDETRLDVFRVLILPQQDTPYASGAFLFDFFLPDSFPEKPPQVTFLTTGAGSVRFNPNLYNCGKVCLSLLGTWAGPSWDPHTSTILQVLISLQAMVFVKDPFFNEPGYEKMSGSEEGDRRTRKYNDATLRNTIKWAMRAPLQSPLDSPHGVFRDVLWLHWTTKCSMLLAQLDVAKERLRNAGDHELIDEVKGLLLTFEERYDKAVREEKRADEAAAQEEVRRRKLEEDAEVLRRMREAMGAPAE